MRGLQRTVKALVSKALSADVMRQHSRELAWGVFCAGLGIYFSTAGIIHMLTAQVVLIGTWISGCLVITELAWPRKIVSTVGCLGLGLLLFALNVWTVRHRPPDVDQAQLLTSMKEVHSIFIGMQNLPFGGLHPFEHQRYLPEGKIEAMLETLWTTGDHGKERPYKVTLIRGGSFEAEGFSAQMKLVFSAAGWIINADVRAFPPSPPDSPIIVEGQDYSDPGLIAVKNALMLAGYNPIYRKGGPRGVDRMVNLYF